jgi:hypothetical protein
LPGALVLALGKNLLKKNSLPSTLVSALGKEFITKNKKFLCRVPEPEHWAKNL